MIQTIADNKLKLSLNEAKSLITIVVYSYASALSRIIPSADLRN